MLSTDPFREIEIHANPSRLLEESLVLASQVHVFGKDNIL